MLRMRRVGPVIAFALALLPTSVAAQPHHLRLRVEDAAGSLQVDTLLGAGDVGLTTSDAAWRRSDTGVAIGVVVMIVGAIGVVPGIVWLSDPCTGDVCASGLIGAFAVGIGGALVLIGGLVALASS